MPATVPKNYLTKDFKSFLKLYKKVATVREVLQNRSMRQQQALSETQMMLEQLDARAKQLLDVAPHPVEELQEQEG